MGGCSGSVGSGRGSLGLGALTPEKGSGGIVVGLLRRSRAVWDSLLLEYVICLLQRTEGS